MTAPVIRHDRDLLLADDGSVEQDYRFLDYDFTPMGVAAGGRMYLDDAWTFSFRTPDTEWSALPAGVRDYLAHRFDRVQTLGAGGYRPIWTAID